MYLKTLKGFTLIEIMIVVAIIGILSAIAYPSYQESVRKSRRADARAVLLEAAQFMERRYTENLTAGYGVVTALPTTPTNLTQSPQEGAAFYVISFSVAPTQAAFALQATPQGAQSSDKCGTLTLTNTGAKGQITGKTVDECWR